MRKFTLLLLAAIGALFAYPVQAQQITELSFVTPLPSTFEIKYLRDHVLVSQNGLKVYDVSNPSNPALVATRTYPGSVAQQLAAEGNRAYMSHGNNGIFAVYDITTIDSPSLLGTLAIPAITSLTVGDVVPHGSHVYVGGIDTVFVVDVSNGATPQLVGSIAVPGAGGFSSISAMVVEGTTLYVLSDLLSAFDISSPAAPTLLTSIAGVHHNANGRNGMAADTVGHRIFTPWAGTLRQDIGYDAYDVSNPAAPTFLYADSTTFANGDFGECAYYRNTLLVSRGGGVLAFDVSAANHGLRTTFLGQNVPNATVSIVVRDSVFFNGRRGGIEVLQYRFPDPTAVGAELPVRPTIAFCPNPATDYVQITSPTSLSGFFTLLDARGQTVRALPADAGTTWSIPLTGLPPGLYFLRHQGADGRAGCYKVVKE